MFGSALVGRNMCVPLPLPPMPKTKSALFTTTPAGDPPDDNIDGPDDHELDAMSYSPTALPEPPAATMIDLFDPSTSAPAAKNFRATPIGVLFAQVLVPGS